MSNTHHIWCSAYITQKMEDVIVGHILGLAQKQIDVDEYVFYITCIGGSPSSAINLHNFLKSIPQRTTAYNMAGVASAGVLFFLGFETRIGVPGCSFMIHQTTYPRAILPEHFTTFDAQTRLDELATSDKKTRLIIESATSSKASKPLTINDIEDAMLRTTTYYQDDALDHGFIERIETPKLPGQDVLYVTDHYLEKL